MSWFPKGVWPYAILVVLLLVIAAVAARETIASITEFVLDVKHGFVSGPVTEDLILRIITVPVLALTMGFLFLAGALGVGAIRTTAQIEGRRRVGRFVDAMDYISDGLLAVDVGGRVTGSNAPARQLAAGGAEAGGTLREMFPCLAAEDERLLLDSKAPQEVECVAREAEGLRALRFRSQPSEDMNLLMVSDVTGRKSEEMRARQVARLQLIGRIARGVAHDFNNILCAVSGYASLLSRQKNGVSRDDENSLKAIVRESQRGAALAGQLLDLSRTGVRGEPCDHLAMHVGKAAELLRIGLSTGWQVVPDVSGDFPRLPLTDIQVEQAVLNLGLLVSDELATPGFVHIRVRAPGEDGLFEVGKDFAAVGLISAYGPEPEASASQLRVEAQSTVTESGVIQSVVRSMLEEVGGRLDILVAAGNRHTYRICFPRLVESEGKMSALARVPEALRMQIAGWKVLLAGAATAWRNDIEGYLEETGINVEIAADIVSALQQVEAGRELNAMILDRRMLGEEADALLRAVLKLRPLAGVIVLCDEPQAAPADLKQAMVFEPSSASPDAILQAVVKAREMALRRKVS